jgi:DedD protein
LEINLKQRVIGGVVLIALAVIFVPLLFSNNAPKTKHQQLTLETSIPAQPMRPSRETTINLQGEELNPQKNALPTSETVNIGEPSNVSVAQVSPQTSAPIAKANPPTVSEMPATKSPRSVVTKEVKTKLNAQDQALLEPMDSKATPEVRTVKPVEVKAAKKEAKKIKVLTVTPTEVKHKKLPAAKAWVVQLGSFGNVAKAKTLEKQLREKGFTVYSHSVKTSLGSMTRVFVGPEIKREKAEAIKVKLDHQLHIKGVVVAFQPAKAKNT